MITQHDSNLAESIVRKPGPFHSVVKSITASDPAKTDKEYAIVTFVLKEGIGDDTDDSDIGKDVKFFLSLKVDPLPDDIEALDEVTQKKLNNKFSAQKQGLQTTYNFYRAAGAYELFDENGNIKLGDIDFDEQTLVNAKLDIIVKNRNGAAEASGFIVDLDEFISNVADYYAKGTKKTTKVANKPKTDEEIDPFAED
jgi:hypothetical protein